MSETPRTADVRSADVRSADVRSADVRSADVRSADVRSADVRSADVRMVDVRGPRFAAWVTSAVLAVALVLGSGVLVAVQAAIFAVGAFAGLRFAPYGVLFRSLVAPRLGPAGEREPEAPPRFAQLVGLGFAVVGAAGYLLGAPAVGAVATGLALVAALLNAATGFCLGCELYLIARRALPART